jgi:xylan 1,4-beta-xylosidase
MNVITNPILRGFNPDPSIVRVNDDYYIATSTFEWFPGIQIHHSKDLVNWQLISRVLTKKSQLDLRGVPDSCGVWAPCLSYSDGVFYLVYSNVKSFDGVWKDTPNYLITTKDIHGEWSDPIFLSASGFDASLFHDDDGRKWYITMLVDHRKGKFFGGILLQEYDPVKQKLLDKPTYIFEGTSIGKTEAPHLYKKDGYYYLILAEGGTEYNHSITLCRSRNIQGPYEVHPNNPLITSSNNPSLPLQKAGHGDFVQTQTGEWYIVFLVARPLSERGRCILGRETAIQKIRWEEGAWPELFQGGNEPSVQVEAPALEQYPFSQQASRDDFDEASLNIHFQSLRVPIDSSWMSIVKRPGFLRIKGRESLSSFHNQSMIARRVQHHHTECETCIEFEPQHFQQLAGLVCYYNTSHYHYLHITANNDGSEKLLTILSCDKFNTTEPLSEPVNVTGVKRIYLKAVFEGATIQFYYAITENAWNKIGPVLDGSILSDDYVQDQHIRYRPAFTGAFVGMACQDLRGENIHADFDWFEYNEITKHTNNDNEIRSNTFTRTSSFCL